MMSEIRNHPVARAVQMVWRLCRHLSAYAALTVCLAPPAQAQTIGNVANGASLFTSASCIGCHHLPPVPDHFRLEDGVDWRRIKASIFNSVNESYPGLPYRSAVFLDMARYRFGSEALSDAQLKDLSAYLCSTLASTASTCNAGPLDVPASIATVSATSLSFGGAITAGLTSAARTVTLTNSGSLNLTGTYSLTGAMATDFAMPAGGAGACAAAGFTLTPGASCSVAVQYQPAASGSSSASLSFVTNAVTSPVIALAGLAGAPPAPVANLAGTGVWTPVEVTRSGSTMTFTLSNDGNAALLPGVVRVTGTAALDFSVSNNCPVSLAAAGTCAIQVVFTPQRTGAREAVLEVQSNASGPALSANLSGTGNVITGAAPTDVAPVDPAPGGSTVTVSLAGTQSGAGGGCSAGDPDRAVTDPVLWLLCLGSALSLLRRKRPSPVVAREERS